MKKILLAVVALVVIGGILSALGAGSDAGTGLGSKAKPITAANTPEFAAILRAPQDAKTIGKFADKYGGKYVEFDGTVEDTWWADYTDDVKTAVVRVGRAGAQAGPRFSMYAETPDGKGVKTGDHVHVVGEVGAFEHDDMNDTISRDTNLMRLYIVDETVTIE